MTGPLHPLWSDEEAKPTASKHMDALDTFRMDWRSDRRMIFLHASVLRTFARRVSKRESGKT